MDDYEKNFCPFNIREKAHKDISRLYQKPGRDKDGTSNDGFQDYINEFQNLATKAKFKDKLTACSHFSAGLDQQISTMILSMATPPDTLDEWLDKAKLFHGHKLRIDDLRSGNCSYPFHPHQNSSLWTSHDPNTMKVDFVKLKMLSPQEWAKCMKEGCCFKCRKIRHDARNCRTNMGKTQQNPWFSQTSRPTQQVGLTTSTQVTPTVTTSLVFSSYAQTLRKTEEELLQTLKLCYEEPEEPTENVAVATTFKSLNKEGF